MGALHGRVDGTRGPTVRLPRAIQKTQLRFRAPEEIGSAPGIAGQTDTAVISAAIARELGTQTKALRTRHPVLCGQIVKRYAAEKPRRRREREEAIVEGIAALVDDGRISDLKEFQRLRRLTRFARARKFVALGRRLARMTRSK